MATTIVHIDKELKMKISRIEYLESEKIIYLKVYSGIKLI